ncbi:hypothetical protein AB0L05_00715 [Nonomuraea pusilla]|uniref:hypothetical protein n=1 Tax=Nonomuraea pusilla TaxID=46177 RepID=UPI00332185FB
MRLTAGVVPQGRFQEGVGLPGRTGEGVEDLVRRLPVEHPALGFLEQQAFGVGERRRDQAGHDAAVPCLLGEQGGEQGGEPERRVRHGGRGTTMTGDRELNVISELADLARGIAGSLPGQVGHVVMRADDVVLEISWDTGDGAGPRENAGNVRADVPADVPADAPAGPDRPRTGDGEHRPRTGAAGRACRPRRRGCTSWTAATSSTWTTPRR